MVEPMAEFDAELASGKESRAAASGKELGSGKESRAAASGKELGSGKESREAGSGKESREAGSGKESREAGSGKESREAGSGKESREAGSGKESREAGSGMELASGKESGEAASGMESGEAASGKKPSEAGAAASGKKQTHKGREVAEQVFKLPLSRALARKVQQKAADEGVKPEELLCELVAEGLVLRAWEIMERKSTMRGGGGSRPQNFNQKGGNRYREQKNRRGFSRGHRAEKGGSALLEDRAAFVEYVRNQEKGNK